MQKRREAVDGKRMNRKVLKDEEMVMGNLSSSTSKGANEDVVFNVDSLNESADKEVQFIKASNSKYKEKFASNLKKSKQVNRIKLSPIPEMLLQKYNKYHANKI